jgi:predicted HTH transcriptional regulator
VPIRGKLISEISAADIFDLITQRTPEDLFLEFKAELLDPRKPKDRQEFDKADWVADVVAFANAQGGHILIGMEADDQERAARLKPIAGDPAKRLADRLRDLAIERIKPSIAQLEIVALEITAPEWIVVARVPHSLDKPYISSDNGRARFTLRDGSRKREMAYDEIREFFLAGPRQQVIVRFLSEIESINSRLADLEKTLRKVD